MRPNTRLTVTQFKRFFTKWWYAPKRMIWDGKYVSIQPVPATTTTATTVTAAAPVTPPRPPVEAAAPAPTALATMPITGELFADPMVEGSVSDAGSADPPAASDTSTQATVPLPLIVGAALAVVAAVLLTLSARPRPPARPPALKRQTTP
jgi:hypothetical protein